MRQGTTTWVGMDVHKALIAICVMRDDSQEEEAYDLLNVKAHVAKFFRRLVKQGEVRACYEAGPCGYEIRRQLEEMGVPCAVIAPSLIPKRAGDRVKTDRRDARKLVRLFRAGELTAVHVPTEREEAVRDLLRCREGVVEDVQRHRHRLLKFLQRHGRMWHETRNWTQAHWAWMRSQKFEHAEAQRTQDEYLAQLDAAGERLGRLNQEVEVIAGQEPWKGMVERLCTLRGIRPLSALTLLAEIHDFDRFESPRDLMAFVGLTPSLYESGGPGGTHRKGGITKTGNAHVRRVLVEAAHHYRHRPLRSFQVRARGPDQPEDVIGVAVKAQERLHRRFRHLALKGKSIPKVVVAVARELVGFMWALMTRRKAGKAEEVHVSVPATATVPRKLAA